MQTILKNLFEEMMTPSTKDESAYLWAAIAATHGLMGAAVACLLPASFWISLGLTAAYAYFKERGDLRRNGRLGDGMVDTFFVGLGLFSPILPLAPALILLCVGIGVVVKAWLESE